MDGGKLHSRSSIEFGNNNIQEQTIWQMIPTILNKWKSKDQLRLSEKDHHHIPELQVLWDNCTDPCHVIALASVGVLVELVSQHVADYNYVMNGFCNRVPAARNLLGPVHGVTSLLCLQIKSAPNASPYTLRSSPHPYIGILANSGNSWAVILQEIQHLFEICHDSPNSLISTFKMFEPFFKYIFLNPKTDYGICRALHSLLLNLPRELPMSGNQEFLDSILDLIMNHISLFQKNMISLGHHVSLCQETLQWIIKRDGKVFEKHLKTLTLLLVELCHEQVTTGIPMMSSLSLLKKITKLKPWVMVTSGTLFALSHFLLSCSEYYLDDLVDIASNVAIFIITSLPNEAVKLSIFILPLLRILVAKSNIPTVKMMTPVKSRATKLLRKIEKVLEEVHPMENVTKHQNKGESCRLPGNWLRKMSMYENIFQFVMSRDESTLLKWIRSVEASFVAPYTMQDCLSNVSLLLASFLIQCNPNTGSRILDVIAVVCKTYPTQSPYFLPLLLFKMERCGFPEFKLTILRTIPRLATHKVCVKQVLQTLLVLNNNADLKPITLRLMLKLWSHQPRVYSHLEKLIQEKPLSLSQDTRVELQLARAATIRDICKERYV